ncbi:MAG: hypothetical protein Q4D98_09215, partial [Planctomycetia bacterium]|nr:hypothetical protein [Planctomycetia bacterium]
KVLTNNITAGMYLQNDLIFTSTSGQNGTVTFENGMTASFTDLEMGGHTFLNIGTSSTSTATVTVSGGTLIGQKYTSYLNIHAGSTFNANGRFQLNEDGDQGKIGIYGTLNLNSSTADSIFLGYGNNTQYTSTVDVYDGGVLNALNSVVHCGYDGQLIFRINAGGTANLYGMTYARNGDTSAGSTSKTLTLNGGTLNLGVGGVSIRSKKDSYPFQLVSGTIGTIDGCDTSISDVELAIGSGNTVFKPVAGATITVNSNFTNSSVTASGKDGKVQMNGAGKLVLAGTFNTTGGFEALAGTTEVSGTFTGGKLNVNGGNTTITTTGSVTSGSSVDVNKGTLTIIRDATGITTSNGVITANAGASVVLTSASDATAHTLFHNPITLNGGTLSTDSSLSSRWRRLHGKLTLTADSTIDCGTRLEIRGGLTGTGYVLTKTGDANLILDSVGTTGLKSIVVKNGMFCIQGSSTNALITTDGIFVEGGYLQFWYQNNVSANVTFSGNGYFQNSGNGSTAANAVFTLKDDTQFDMTSYEGQTANFNMYGKLVAADGVVLNKTGAQTMTLAGDMSAFHGTVRVDTTEMILANGGNTAETAYDFNLNLNAGSARIGDAGTYHFEDVPNLIQFSNANNATFGLGTGSIQNHGTSSISSTVSGAAITGTGAIQLGAAGDTLDFNIGNGASLTVSSAVRTQGGTFTQSGNGTLNIENLYVDSGTFNLNDSAVSAITQGIHVAPDATLTWDGTIALGNVAMNMDGTFAIQLVGDSADWDVDTLELDGNNITLSDAAFELQADFSNLSMDPLFDETATLTLLQTDLDLAGMVFPVLTDGSLFSPELTLYALGNADGSITLHGRLPEPSACVLFLFGGLALLVTWRKRANANL